MPPGAEQFDIFVSYAHVDDQILPGADIGWPSCFVKGLRILLAQKLGREENFKMWFDRNALRGANELDDQIIGVLDRTDMLLLLLSPGYFASKWCMQEQEHFCARYGGNLDGRIVVVELVDIRDDQRARLAFKNRVPFAFWKKDDRNRTARLAFPMPSSNELDYYARLQDVAFELAVCIEERRRVLEPSAAGTEPRPAKPVVALAEVTDDLEERKENLVRRLRDAGFTCVLLDSHGLSTQDFVTRIDERLASASFFVQLLGGFPGKPRPGAPQGYVQLQHERALAAGVGILQWRDPSLPLAEIEDAPHRLLLDADSVQATSFEKFRETVVAEMRASAAPAGPKRPEDSFLFVNADERDYPLAQSILQDLPGDRAWEMPPLIGDPKEIREKVESNILECDDMMIIYGDSGPKWIDMTLRNLRKTLPGRSRQPKNLVVVRTLPTTDRPMPPVHIPGLRVVDWFEGMDPRELGGLVA